MRQNVSLTRTQAFNEVLPFPRFYILYLAPGNTVRPKLFRIINSGPHDGTRAAELIWPRPKLGYFFVNIIT